MKYIFENNKKINACVDCKFLRYEEDGSLYCPVIGKYIIHQFSIPKECTLEEVGD